MYERTKARIAALLKYCEEENKPNPVGFIEYAEGGYYAYSNDDSKEFFKSEQDAIDHLKDCSVLIIIDV